MFLNHLFYYHFLYLLDFLDSKLYKLIIYYFIYYTKLNNKIIILIKYKNEIYWNIAYNNKIINEDNNEICNILIK